MGSVMSTLSSCPGELSDSCGLGGVAGVIVFYVFAGVGWGILIVVTRSTQ